MIDLNISLSKDPGVEEIKTDETILQLLLMIIH